MKTYLAGPSALAELAATVPRETVSPPPPEREGKPWSAEDLLCLESQRGLAWTYEEIAEVLKRSARACRIKASRMKLTRAWRRPHPRRGKTDDV